MEAKSPQTNSEVESEKAGKSREKAAALTAGQLQEFQMQTMAYRYIEAGHPVPLQLVVPIWNSLALSSWSHYLSMIHHHHHFHHPPRLSVDGFINMDMVEAEPTRCRRTDGKKWRCGKDVIPFQKYCQRHMHRGAKRSRKLVEPSVITSSPPPIVSIDQENSNDSYKFTTSSSKAPLVTIASYTNGDGLENEHRDKEERIGLPKGCLVVKHRDSGSGIHGVSANIQCDDRTTSVQRETEAKPRRYCPERSGRVPDMSGPSVNARSKTFDMNVVISPESVLNANGVRAETEKEAGRCRRTDGKKWRCSKEALSGQKYCPKHMHRGVKKFARDSNRDANACSSAAESASGRDRDENISVLFMANSVPQGCDDRSSSRCSTDTTITDTALKVEEEEDNGEDSLCSGS